ncbi:MAG: plasmid recombination protein [Eggerthellaceae bacterium]|nr:plasmid recombination protein [Eggerthellaceae bacterium]
MARNDGKNRASVRNANLTDKQIGNAQRHNEREKESYTNPDIVPERTAMNVHYKQPTDSYAGMFAAMEREGVISTRGLKDDAKKYGELIFDVNTAYFDNNGGYEFAKQFYADAYRAAVKIVGGEQFILSAVMHADERNRAMSEALGRDVYHYHLHVVYIPVVEKKVLWTKRCRDPALVGTVKETITQVSSSKKWRSNPAVDENGNPILNKKGKPVIQKSYSVLQDDFYQFMRSAGYGDIERGEYGSSEVHLTVTQFKVAQEQQRLAEVVQDKRIVMNEITQLEEERDQVAEQADAARDRIKELAPKLKDIESLTRPYLKDPDEVLPQPGALESARTYRDKRALPLLKRILQVLRGLFREFTDLKYKHENLQREYSRELGQSERLRDRIHDLIAENEGLRATARDFDRVSRFFGRDRVTNAVETVKWQENAQIQSQQQSQPRPIRRHQQSL